MISAIFTYFLVCNILSNDDIEGQAASYFRRFVRKLVSKPAISSKKVGGGCRTTTHMCKHSKWQSKQYLLQYGEVAIKRISQRIPYLKNTSLAGRFTYQDVLPTKHRKGSSDRRPFPMSTLL